MALLRVVLVTSLFALASAAYLRNTSVASPHQVASEQTQVKELRAKLQKVEAGLIGMLKPTGALASSKVAQTLNTFVTQLSIVLKETDGAKDSKKALKRLQDAQASVRGLVADVTTQQMRLMKQGDEQEQSLLVGVLLTKQKEPMDEQLAVLRSEEFSHLPVVAAVLAAKDGTTPLFQQVATYLDKHSGKATPSNATAAIPNKLKRGKDGKPDVSPIVNALEHQLQHLQENKKRQDGLHTKEMDAYATAIKKNPKLSRRIQSVKKASNRKFLKQEAISRNDIKSLESAIDAVKKGDTKALGRVQAALEASMKSMQASSHGFLYLIQLAHRSEGLDCPYCAAQCVEKCHVAGKSYVSCLAECADAGK